MDIHFDLADAMEDADAGHCITAADIRHLQHGAAAIQETIDRLADEVCSSSASAVEEAVGAECDEAVA